MAFRELAPGLHRWTVRHEEWREDVGCLALETGDGLVLIDPLEPPPELGPPRHVLLTVFWHHRALPGLEAESVWASGRTVRALANRGVQVTDPIGPETVLPGGLEALETARHGELVYRLPRHGAIAVGDVLLGAGAKPRPTDDPLRLCPERWLGKATHDELRSSLRPLLERPVERVLVSHGEPVLADAHAALERVLHAPSAA
jgi:glyoxylase-like metal-dependent hydrolase (beta-lactamase superfamily II)